MVISPLCYSSIFFGVWEIFLYPIGDVSYGGAAIFDNRLGDRANREQRTVKFFIFILQMCFILYIYIIYNIYIYNSSLIYFTFLTVLCSLFSV